MRSNQKNITTHTKIRASQLLLEGATNGKLQNGKLAEVAHLLQISIRSVASIWSETKKKIATGESIIFSPTKWFKHKDSGCLDKEKMLSIPFKKRSTIRRLATSLGTSKSLVGRWVKSGLIRAHTNAIKSVLTQKNILLRLRFSLSSLNYDRALNVVKFRSMHNIVHIDEKWFYITNECERHYLTPGEVEPYRTCKNKRYITKLMFMCAVARPQYASNGELIFDGKIGIFPFTKTELALRNNKNRLKGTIETKPIESITKEVIKECIINKVIPAIKSKWPSNSCRNILIQQDNAKPHIANTDIEFRAAAKSDGFNINLICQPPNSPDTNVNDLGWFRAIQSLQTETSSFTVDDLIENVKLSFEQLALMTLNNVFLTLQSCLTEIMKCKGSNNYKVPHMNKTKMIREGNLPKDLEVDGLIVREALDYLMQEGNDSVSTYDVDALSSALL